MSETTVVNAVDDRPRRSIPLDQQHLDSVARRWRRNGTTGGLLGAWENFVFRLENGQETAILRITEKHRRSEQEIAGELAVMEHLAHKGFPVPIVQRFGDGTKILSIEVGQRHFSACLFSDVAGVQIPARSILAHTEEIESWGSMIGSLHNAIASFQSLHPVRRTWAENDLMDQASVGSGLPEKYVQLFRSIVADLRKRAILDDDFGLVHADLHGRNVLADDSARTVIDFDDMCYHWYGYDLAVACNWLCQAGGESDRIYGALLTGYTQVRNVSQETVRLLSKLGFLRTYLDFMFIDRHARAGVQSPLISAHREVLTRCLQAQVAAAA